ncbi:MAG: hypothetical protein R3D90_04385 [Paracoccaceae bacterium]
MKTVFFFLSLLFGLGLALAATGSGPGHLLIAFPLTLGLGGLALRAIWLRLPAHLPTHLPTRLASQLAAGRHGLASLARHPAETRPAGPHPAGDLLPAAALLALMGLMLAANTGIQP